MLVLFETPVGFALFKVLDEGKLDKVEDLSKKFLALESARKVVSLKAFSKFENAVEALETVTKLLENAPNKAKLDFSEILPEEVEIELKEATTISMGTEINDLDLMNIKDMCDQVLNLAEYQDQLCDYLNSRMNTVAPNLTALVGARLIAHGGSLLNLSKQPSSTVQILGAEKALFRALKIKHSSPKYGIIYHASLVGQAAPKRKGKISRSLAAKAALVIRCDAHGDDQDNFMGLEIRAKLEE
ncbi:Nucleolar protein 58 [Hibiscus syriacus]|uniref:Nucleolar protein 58 n=1 Tax=Hibiscus syriacus TaxID=106335 RepID=A0A6A2YHL8_HIBSY|nr:Nucleolar protein 58 [Hibiscus syriacus]